MRRTWSTVEDRLFDPSRREVAREIYDSVKDLPLVCPHGHVAPGLLADPDASLGSPADLFVIPDHYVFRMLHSRGIPMEDLGVAACDGARVESDHRRIWQRFCDNFHLFRGTPSGLWLREALTGVFEVEEKPGSENAQRVYDHLEERLSRAEFSPRALFDRFGIEVLCTTDSATAPLDEHVSLREEGWGGRIRPTFRPDGVTDILNPGWRTEIDRLSELSRVDVTDFASFLDALRERRTFFRKLGAVASDHGVVSPATERMPEGEAGSLFARSIAGEATETDARRFSAHMLWEMARMSTEDGLVMQLHAGSLRNHNHPAYKRFGSDAGADIPIPTEWTRNLRPLLNDFGASPGFRLIVYTLDESSYSRELAPMAGHYPALHLGAPWWFLDSPNGMRRYLDAVVETAGVHNLAGFNDDTRAFASIPVRHNVWRRVTSDWLARLVVHGQVDEEDARVMARELAYDLPRRVYGFDDNFDNDDRGED